MLEMGQYAAEAHFKIGQYARKKADFLIAVGADSKKIVEGFNQPEAVYHFDQVEDAVEKFLELLNKDDVILIKASRGVHLERLVLAIREGK
ncbi:hypothetical protein Q5O14_14770 [Eubacteriaceae bacterium ES2]|nr:hypothetical protein Q5O14_14770 [Eubacteriaceae bacterium ES2]